MRIVQDTAFATWIRESSWALFFLLIVHTMTMGFMVGTGLVIGGRMLGLFKRIPLPGLGRLLPVIAWALAFAVPSGLLLLAAYPAKALTNPLFYVKLAMAIAALLITLAFRHRVFRAGLSEPPGWARGLAALSMLLWVGALTAGKFLEYTHHVLLVY